MLIGLIKSIIFMFFFYYFLKFLSFFTKFIYFFFKKKYLNENFNDNENKTDSTIKMLQCEKCKIYILKTDAYIYNGRVFCKKEHSYKD